MRPIAVLLFWAVLASLATGPLLRVFTPNSLYEELLWAVLAAIGSLPWLMVGAGIVLALLPTPSPFPAPHLPSQSFAVLGTLGLGTVLSVLAVRLEIGRRKRNRLEPTCNARARRSPQGGDKGNHPPE